MKARFFKTPAELRAWFERNHAKADEIVIAFHKKATGKAGVDYAQALDEALSFGWSDGVRKGGETSWSIRFTPRKKKSYWSAVNIRHAERLIAQERMTPVGAEAFAKRDASRANAYAYENRPHTFPPDYEARFRAKARAWKFWQAQAPSYRRTAIFWVLSAKKEETRERRLATLIDASAREERARALIPPGRRA